MAHEIKIDSEYLIIASWLILMLVAARGAIRLFFVITPFAAFMGSYFITNIPKYSRASKDKTFKLFAYIVIIAVIILSLFSLISFIKDSSAQTSQTGPSASYQWQKAMAWVRENTIEGGIFVHWWDYGYWIQYLGERPTLADGGQFQGAFRNHLIGRYLLTATDPNVALSFMKSNNVSYLLIDSTDLGKYGAYSKIGSDGKDKNYDRFSPSGGLIALQDYTQTIESDEGTKLIYPMGVYSGSDPSCNTVGNIDEDIQFVSQNGETKFLPGPSYDDVGRECFKSSIIATIVDLDADGNFKQPTGVFEYNNQQAYIPIRYLYSEGNLMDFGSGLDSVVYILPRMTADANGVNIDRQGAVIYLSEKVQKSLFAQLYLLDNAFGKYNTLELIKSQDDSLIETINQRAGSDLEFVYYGGFRGPIKIWGVDYPKNILTHEEFTQKSGDWAEFDALRASS